MNLKDNIRLNHILDACLELEELISILKNLDEYLNNRYYKHSSVRLLEIIGEATASLSEEIRHQEHSIDWQSWKDLRNVLIHQYFGVDYERIFLILKEEIPILKKEIESILK